YERRRSDVPLRLRYVGPDRHAWQIRCRVDVPLGINALGAAVLAVALPGHDKISRRIRSYGRDILIARRVGVDSKLTAVGDASGVIQLGVRAPSAAVLIRALPNHNKVARTVHCHQRIDLIIRGVGIDSEFAPLRRASSVVSLRVSAVPAA